MNRIFIIYGKNEDFYKFKSIAEIYLKNSCWIFQEKNKSILFSLAKEKENQYVFIYDDSEFVYNIMKMYATEPVYLVRDDDETCVCKNNILCNDIKNETIHFVYSILSESGEQGSIREV